MPTITFTSSTGEKQEIVATVGESVMQTAVRNGIREIVGDCGGVLSCATCHVFVDSADADRLPEVSEMEDAMLDGTAVDRTENSRLACQLEVSEGLGDLHVTTPECQE
ncbi:2Fe-2S iron-sulfur cluster-binding protein [Nocardia anaemiae]|uniref:2Fe-2S iron-sulfur cluster-binding protein n=1 Tax=Nocardia anaemiae TaxID=263910 RepID=UPI0007A53B17|nr:2Fe-2S iron-sulfur cluster-binding protein [Nocardia anaemiae]